MEILALSAAQLESLLDHNHLRAAMVMTMQEVSGQKAQNFPRFVTGLKKGALGFMAASLGEGRALGYKAVSVFPGNATHALNPHQGIVVLLDPETGLPRALLDGSTITALRTASVSAAATALLANPRAKTLALVGNGRQAYEHARAIAQTHSLETIRLWGREPVKSRALAKALQARFAGAIEIASSPQNAVALADIVVAATPSPTPLFSTLDLQPGCHLNAVGSSRPGFCEVTLMARPGLRLVLDSRAACGLEAEEIISASKQGAIRESDIVGELGELFAAGASGRQAATDITVFKSVGLGIQDVAAAEFFYRRAQASGIGQRIEF